MIDRFAFTAMTGAKHAIGQLATTTHNMANLQTPGFREMLSMFRAVPVDGSSADSRAFVVDSTPGADWTPGSVTPTAWKCSTERGWWVESMESRWAGCFAAKACSAPSPVVQKSRSRA